MSQAWGFKEIVIKLVGKNVYSTLKFESGGHKSSSTNQLQKRKEEYILQHALWLFLAEVENISEINVKPEEIRVDVFQCIWSWRTACKQNGVTLSGVLIYRQG
ncbi:MAG: hypothetical protein CM15mP58_07650 [Burkholderiaceae bacterium]|nr:MAG: hypothetical protein CM15mP58_07650 [Burkholderiaceae bacterium]